MSHVLVIHGPNLNLLGSRETALYGKETLDEINQTLQSVAGDANISLTSVQTNSESEMIALIQKAPQKKVSHILINPAAFTHTSIALRDALLAVQIPFIEVHLSNIHARESFRQHSYLSDIAEGVITGLGSQGYVLALQSIITKIHN